MTMRTQYEKMEFSRCTPFIIRCATKTLRDSTSTHENIMCDFSSCYNGYSIKCLFLDWKEKLRHINNLYECAETLE